MAEVVDRVALQRAIADGELVVHFQPEICLSSGTVIGVEALVRWARPGRGLTPPGDFLPLAEATGLIGPLGDVVLEIACRTASTWHTHGRGPTLWVNISGRQLTDPTLVDRVSAAVERWLPDGSLLGLEVTESALTPDGPAVDRLVDQLRQLGVRLAIDDFGTGYASLAYLWRFPADTVKLDRSFVGRLDDDREATVIVAGTIQLARSLGRTTVAEGVETLQQLVRLRRLGCDLAQGFLLARPAPAAELDALLRTPIPMRGW